MAVPVHGAHGARHVLNARSRRAGRAALAVALAAAGAGIVLGGCAGGGDPVDPAVAGGAAGAVAGTPSAVAARGDTGGRARDGGEGGAPGGLATRLAAAFADARAASPDADRAVVVADPRWPADLGAHADVPLEVREWLSVLRDAAGTVYGLRQRVVRIALPVRAGGGAAAAPSPWRYGAVVRVDGTLEREGGTPVGWTSAEREAVGLAGTPPPPAVGLRVLDDAIAGEAASAAGGCALDWSVTATDVARLTGRATGCPVGNSAGGVAVATFPGFAVSGTLLAGGGAAAGPLAVSGIGWQRMAWGAPPALGGGGAVLFDRATLTLAGVGSFELLRSKRASGRGEPRTTATALDAGAREAGLVDGLAIEWRVPAAGADARDAGSLSVPALGIGVDLRALSPVLPADDGLERVFRGAVVAAGTHAGAGFVEHRPLPTAPAAGDGSGKGERT